MTGARSWFCVSVALAFVLTAACSPASKVEYEAPGDTGGTPSSGAATSGMFAGGTPSSDASMGGASTSGSAATGGASNGDESTGGTSTSGESSNDDGSDGGMAATAASSGGTAGAPSSSDGGNGDAAGAPAEAPYANVTAVAVSGDAGSYTFDVTIESADVDCSQYADWWEVLTADGTLVYRRILEHSHTDANGTSDPNAPGNTFTRSGGPVSVQASDVVLVRAHMNDGGYNGRVMRGSMDDGFTPAPDIGSNFATNVESEAPLPTDCEF